MTYYIKVQYLYCLPPHNRHPDQQAAKNYIPCNIGTPHILPPPNNVCDVLMSLASFTAHFVVINDSLTKTANISPHSPAPMLCTNRRDGIS